MPAVSGCPPVADYRKLLSGQTPAPAAADLAGHLETCEQCAAAIQTLLNEDSLGESVRAGSAPSLGHLPPDLVSKLMSLSGSVVPMAASVGDTQATQDGAARVARGDKTVSVTPGMAAPQADGEVGRLGGYRILEVLGEGGMGLVYRAEDVSLQRLVALKVMKPDLARNDNSRKRFLAEARAAAKVRSDHVVTIYQTGEHGETAFAAMELLRGEPLDAWLRGHRDGPMSEFIRIGRETALGLHAAHQEGLIHRDIKPANIWIESGGRVKILDFGLARSVEGDVHLTNSGAVVGTPAYMAPEQASGRKVDHRADLFSLGCVLHRMTTGQMPFKGDTVMSILTALAIDTPEPAHVLNPAVPRRLSDLISRLLAKDPALRPPTALAVADELKAILAGEVAVREPSTANYVPQATAVVSPAFDESPSEFDFGADTAVVSRRTAAPDDESDDESEDHPPARRPAARSRKPLVFVAVAVLAAIALAAAAAQLIFSTKDGTLVVEVDDDADVRFRKGKLEVYDAAGKLKYTLEPSEKNKTLPPGKYLVKVVGADGVKLETDAFELTSNGKASVRVKAGGPVAVAGQAPKKDAPSKEPKPGTPFVPPAAAWQPTPEQKAFIEGVALVSPDKRIEMVQKKLIEVAGFYNERAKITIDFDPKDGSPTKCAIDRRFPIDALWPIAALPSIRALDIRAPVLDISPVSRLPLTEINVFFVLDNLETEAALKGMTTLKTINGQPAATFFANREKVRENIKAMTAKEGSRLLPAEAKTAWLKEQFALLHPERPNRSFGFDGVTFSVDGREEHGGPWWDLTPLRGVWVERLEANFFPPLFDLRPLAGMGLTSINAAYADTMRDLTPLKGLPLKHFRVHGSMIADIEPLRGAPLETFILEPRNDNHNGPFLLSDLSPLKGAPLKEVSLMGSNVKSLAGLEGAPLLKISVSYSGLEDITALKGLKTLTSLDLGITAVSDISALAGLSFTSLSLSDRVSDLSALKGAKIDALSLGGWKADLSPLKDAQIESLNFSLRLYSDADEQLIRGLGLKKINGKSPDDFWKEIEQRRKTEATIVDKALKLKIEKESLKAATESMFGPYFNATFEIEDGKVVEMKLETTVVPGHMTRNYTSVMAFPAVRKLSISVPDRVELSLLRKLPDLEELTCTPELLRDNLPVLKQMPKLKTINGKPAKEVLAKKDPPGNEPKKDVPFVPPANAWKPTAEQRAYLEAVAVLPANERPGAVLRKMIELNPVGLSERPPVGFELDPKDGQPTSCRVTSPITFEGWPLAALTSLKKIDLTETHILDFRPLAALPLEEIQLKLILDNAASEAALKAMPTLKTINGIAAKDFWAERATVRADIEKMTGKVGALSPEDQTTWVRGVMKRLHPKVPDAAFNSVGVVKLENGLLQFGGYDLHAGVYDFSPVRALPVESFFMLDGNLFDATPLGRCKTLKKIVLQRGNAVRDLSPLAGLSLTELHMAGSCSDIRPLKGMPLKRLSFGGTKDTDLSPLQGMPLESLELGGVKDLKPLAGLKLKRLVSGHYSPIDDLSPLKGMPLEVLLLHRSKVTDLSPLAGMTFKEFDILESPVADFSPLKGSEITSLNIYRGIVDPTLATLPLKHLHLRLRLYSEAEEKTLRGMKLETINGMKPDDFWKDVEKRRKDDADKTAEMAKVPLEAAALEKALWVIGQYPKVKIENGAVVEVHAGHANGGLDNPFAVLLAFPKLRKLTLDSGGDYSALSKLTELEELHCAPPEVAFNRLALKQMPKLKAINGKPAKEVLGDK
jgi:serine/threonine protein kinase/Leucine-rich repeat (LRR) protein